MYKLDSKSIFLFLVTLFLDRITKWLVVSGVWQDQDITSFLELYTTYNRGISWGLGSSSEVGQFLVVSGLVFLVICFFSWYALTQSMNRYAWYGCVLVLSGAVSNFIDRLWFGGVVDFIRFYWHDWSFPVFNVADVFISVGVLLLIYFHVIRE